MSVTQISAKDAFSLLTSEDNVLLIDVRTYEETHFVGFVDPASIDEKLVLLPWKLFPEMKINKQFGTAINEIVPKFFGEDCKENTKLIFICRSGGRSDQAAFEATTLGYKNCYNVISGFEGDVNANNHRGTVNGWKADNLPWRQS